MTELNLTPTSYLVLGLVAGHGPITSYELKRVVGISIGCFWSFPHSQLYAEPARLTEHGLLSEKQERGGRRRRSFSITPTGREALEDWLAEPTAEGTEIRDLGLLKLFFGELAAADDVIALADAKEQGHRTALAAYERLHEDLTGVATAAELSTLELGMRWERTAADFWSEIKANPPTA